MTTVTIQSQLDTGGVVTLPPGTYETDRTLILRSGTTLRGPATLRLAPGVPMSTWLLKATGAGITIEDIELDGNAANQTIDEHRHGVFAVESIGLALRRVTARNFTGDGFYLYEASDTVLEQCRAFDNTRNGLTMGGMVTGVTMRECTFADNAAQQVDSEPLPPDVVRNVTIERCRLDVGTGNDYALTISGSASAQGSDWTVIDCEIRGGVLVSGACDVLLGWCKIDNPTTKSTVEVWRSSTRVNASGCRLHATQTTHPSVPVIGIYGTSGSGPQDIVVSGCDIRGESDYGIRAQAAVSVRAYGNRIMGSGLAAVHLRASLPERPFTADVRDNVSTGYAAPLAVIGPVALTAGE